MIVSVHCVFAKNEAIHYVHLFFLQCGTTVLTCGAHPSMTFCCRILEADGPDCNVILGCVQPAEIELSYPRVSIGLSRAAALGAYCSLVSFKGLTVSGRLVKIGNKLKTAV